MVSYTQFGFHWIVCVIFLLVFQEYNCSGTVEVKFISSVCSEDVGVKMSCCKGIGNRSSPAKPCSRELFVCLVKGIGENAHCLSENHTLGIHQFCNGTLNLTAAFNFSIPWAGVSLRVSLHLGSKNECSPGSPVLIRNDTVSIYTGAPQPQLFGVRRNFIQGNLNLTHSNLTYQYAVYCDQNFYGKCDTYCVPGNTTNCTKNGIRICKAGLTGSNCTIQTCSTKGCHNNGSCINETCNCIRNYTGTFCETSTADTTSEASPSKYHLASTLSDQKQVGKDEDSDNKAAMYAGIGVGVVLAIALAAVIAYVLFRKKHRVGHKNFKKSDEGEQKQKVRDDNVLKEQTVPG